MEGLKVCVIGGGSTYTPELIEGFIKRKKELPVSRIALTDIDEAKLKIVGSLAIRMVRKASVDAQVDLTTDRRRAVEGADFIITQIRVGGIPARIQDERIPLEFDVIGQETTGPGGFAKALRTIPAILDIARDIEELAPDAWLINFTNPSGIITEALLKHSRVNTIGLCNVPIGMLKSLATKFGVKTKDVFLTYVGLALGFLGSALALPFGLYVLICQRDPEAPPADGVTPPDGPRAVVAAVAIGLALLVLLPAAPDVVDAGRAGGMFM